MRISLRVIGSFVAALVLLVAVLMSAGATHGQAGSTFGLGREKGGESRDGEGGGDQDRVLRTGAAPRIAVIEHIPTQGWAGEQLFSPTGNDWEPAVVADPGAPYVVMLTTRYNTSGMACAQCPLPYIVERASADGGVTFGAEQYICMCVGNIHGQYDPQITADAAGAFYASWIAGGKIVFAKSTDHGATWSTPAQVSAPGQWGDHPWITVSQTGLHVYINFNHADSWVAASHDGGTTWAAPVRTSHTGYFHYAGGGFADASGNATLVDESFTTIAGVRSYRVEAFWSGDGGSTWHTQLIDTAAVQTPPCINTGCYRSFFGGHAALAADSTGMMMIGYDRSAKPYGYERVYVRTATAPGAPWSSATLVSPPQRIGTPNIAAFPALAAAGVGDFRVWYQDDRNGPEAWNTTYTTTSDGGATWTVPVRVSDAISGTAYKSKKGYLSPYGDYFEATITSTGKSFGVWGEGKSYWGPGGTWYNRQT